MIRALARAVLALMLAASLVLTLWSAVQIGRDPMLRPLIDRTAAQIAGATDRMIAREATPQALADRLAVLLADQPRNWVAIQAVEGVAAERGLTLPPDVVAARTAAWDTDSSYLTQAGECAACIWDAAQCSLSNALICNAPVTISPVGDLLGLSRAAVASLAGEDIDQIDLALSLVGLGATALVVASGGTSASVKIGAGLARLARRMDLLSPRLTAGVADAVRGAVDFPALAAARSTDDLMAAVRTDRLAPVAALASDLGRMRDAVGTTEALHLLRYVDDGADARRLARTAEALGPRTVGRLEVLGKSRVLRATLRWSDEAAAALAGLIGLLGSLAGLIGGLVQGRALRLLRRLL